MPSLKNIHYVKKLADYLGLTLDEILLGSSNKDDESYKEKTLANLIFNDDDRAYEIRILRNIKR